jgi:hypothetical protein
MGSRAVGYISKEFKYLKNFATTISVIYTGQSGQSLSYLYSNYNAQLGTGNTNITGDDIGSTTQTSLAFIPATFAQANFADIPNGKTASQQWADFQAFIQDNKYLRENQGKNAERNADRLPFENHFDFRIAQDFLFKKQKLQVFFDVVNIGALFNANWGRAYGGSGADGFFPVSQTLFTPVVTQTGVTLRKDGVPFTANASNPAFQFNINNFTRIGNTVRPYQVADFTSRWNSQIGLRYSF